jgi:hypothetical protein
MSIKGVKENRKTWVVRLSATRGVPGYYIGSGVSLLSAKFVNFTTTAVKMAKQTADRIADELNKIRTADDIDRGIVFDSIKVG